MRKLNTLHKTTTINTATFHYGLNIMKVVFSANLVANIQTKMNNKGKYTTQ